MKSFFSIASNIFAVIGIVLAVALVIVMHSDEHASIRGNDGQKSDDSHIETLKMSGPYHSDRRTFNIHPVIAEDRAAEIRDYFQLDTLYGEKASTWEKTLAIARFVATNIPHANQTIQPEKRNAIYLWEYTKNTYWFSCWETIHFDQEPSSGKDAGRYVHLVPKGYRPFGINISDIVTYDAGQFWAAPGESGVRTVFRSSGKALPKSTSTAGR